MLIFTVYDDTKEQAEAVVEILESALDQDPVSSLVVPSVATPEIKRARGISRCPAIVKNGVVLWEGSCPSEAQVLQWVEEHSAQRDQVEGAVGQFGYEESNPIPADGNWYCRRLRCSSGHPFFYHRLGSCGTSPDGHIVDRLHLLCVGRECDVMLYFDMYHDGHSAFVPEGMSLDSEPSGRGTTSGLVSDFPDGLNAERS
jgi:Thioredoxin domain